MPDETPDAALTRFEAQLSGLAPQARLDRDQLLFAAGRRSGARRLRTLHRALLIGNLGWAALLAFAVALAGRGESALGPPSPSGPATTVALGEPSLAPIEVPVFASAEPCANYRLLQSWNRGEWPSPGAPDAVGPAGSDAPRGTTPSRMHLNRLLRDSFESL